MGGVAVARVDACDDHTDLKPCAYQPATDNCVLAYYWRSKWSGAGQPICAGRTQPLSRVTSARSAGWSRHTARPTRPIHP